MERIAMETASPPPDYAWPFPFSAQDWEQTPPSVRAYLVQLQHVLGQLSARVEALEARVNAMTVTSHRPPSSDHPAPRAPQRSTPRRTARGRPGHPGRR